jgi:hypothetical protein
MYIGVKSPRPRLETSAVDPVTGENDDVDLETALLLAGLEGLAVGLGVWVLARAHRTTVFDEHAN